MWKTVGFAIGAVLLAAVVVSILVLIDLIRERIVDNAAWQGAGTRRPAAPDEPERPE
ncbi:hypothetical protein OHS70_37760 [Streptomyces sp. NBC_00390]|uniref:hypothetical protein n=1 Tax=Streptomyces sp. NBC_00390 TaxID=2975736 RepID=UPI002E20E2B4